MKLPSIRASCGKLSSNIERFIPSLGNLFGNLSTQLQGNSDCEEEESP